MWPQIATVLLPSLLILADADRPGQAAPAAEQIERAIEALGNEDFEVREQASELLWRAGRAAGPALSKALHSRDPEVAARAGRILRQFQYGVFPDTPAEVVTLIGRYRFGTEAARLAVLKELLAKGEITTLLTLLKDVPDPRGPSAPWFAEPGPGAETNAAQRRERFSMGLLVASMLLRLNEREQAADLFTQLAQEARNDNNLSLQSLCEAEYRLGLTDQALQHAAVVLSSGWNTSLLRTLFPECQDTAAVWWRFFCQKYPQEPHEITLRRMRRFLPPAPPIDSPDDDGGRLVAEAQTALQELGDADRGKWLAAIGETCLARGEPRPAQDCFLLAAHLAPSAASLTRLGDLAAADTQWDDAARWYRSAWEADRTQPTPLYLQGRSLVQAGRQSEGRTLIEAARLLPLGNAQTRSAFAEDLERRGLTDEALRQWQVTLRTGELQSPAVNQAAQRLGDAAVGKDDLQAAAYWQWPLLRCLRTSTGNLGIEGYLRRAHLIHKTRARGLLAAGRIDEALEEIRLSRAALPGEVELVLELVPLLEKAGRHPDAEGLFADAFAVIQAVCNDFPKSAAHHHDLARLAAGCRRRLDEALEHASQAVALDPKNPTYLGTLAELHFQRGDRQQAVELAQRCVQSAPKQEQFLQQLRRFQTP